MQAVPWAPCLCPWPWNPASAPEGASANRRTRRRAAAAQEQTVNTDLEDIFSRFSFPLALELFFRSLECLFAWWLLLPEE